MLIKSCDRKQAHAGPTLCGDRANVFLPSSFNLDLLLIRSHVHTHVSAFKTQQKNVFLVVFGLLKTIKASLIESKTSGHAI